MVAERSDRDAGIRSLDGILTDLLLCVLVDGFPADPSALVPAVQIAGLQHHVLGQGHVRDHSVAVAVRRAVADAKRYVLRDIQVGDIFPVQCDPSRAGRQSAVEKLTQRILSVSGYTGYSQDLACMDLKVQVCQKRKFIFPLDRAPAAGGSAC